MMGITFCSRWNPGSSGVVSKVEVPWDLKAFAGDPGRDEGVVQLCVHGPIISYLRQGFTPRYAFISSRLVSHVAVVCVVARHSAANLLQGRRFRGGRGCSSPPTFSGKGAEHPHFSSSEIRRLARLAHDKLNGRGVHTFSPPTSAPALELSHTYHLPLESRTRVW